jgi:uncharacterized protein (TIGR02996 family)
VTTEDDFQNQLDRHPEEHQTRLVFADWLEERGDPRAEGYRALGTLKLYPRWVPKSPVQWYHTDRLEYWKGSGEEYCHLPGDWFDACEGGKGRNLEKDKPFYLWHYQTKCAAEDAAALAFARLPPERRAELLAGKGVEELAAKQKKKPKTEARRKGEKKAKSKKGKKK